MTASSPPPRPSQPAPTQRGVNGVDRHIGQRIRARRLQIGVSQERLAEMLGITFQQVQKYEKGVNRVAATRLFAAAFALDVPVSWFFEGLTTTTGSGDPDLVSQVLATPDGVQLMALFAKIESARLRKRVVALTQALAESEA